MGLGHPSTNGCVNIGHDVWIGTGVTILSGVSVGNGAVIGCNSTVAKDVPPIVSTLAIQLNLLSTDSTK